MEMEVDDASPHLKKVPMEVLVRIAHLLTTTDLCSLRLSCRGIEQMLYNDFASEYFSCKQFMYSVFSLEALIDISKSRLGQHLRRLQIGLDGAPDRRTIDTEPGTNSRLDGGLVTAAQLHAEQVVLLTTGLGSDMLAQAVENLANLEEVVIRDNNSLKRNRDGLGSAWRSYGASQISIGNITRGGTWLEPMNQDFVPTAFWALFRAVAKAGSNLWGFELLFRQSRYMSEFAYHIPSPLKPSMLPVLQRLKKLHLSVRFQTTTPADTNINTCDFSRDALDIRKLLSYTPNLEDLRINEQTSSPKRGIFALLRWLADPAPDGPPAADDDDANPSPISLPHLKHLSLGKLIVDDQTLVQLVKKFAPKLTSLELWAVTLLWNTPVDSVDTANGRTWKSVLRQLANIADLELRHIMIGNPNEGRLYDGELSLPFAHHRVSLNPNPERRRSNLGANVIDYTGIDWKHFIRDQAGKITADFDPTAGPSPVYTPGSGGEDEDVSDDAEDDGDDGD